MSDSPKNSGAGRRIRCGEVESLAMLRACGELDAAGLAELSEHIGGCPECAAVVLREGRLQQAIATMEPPADSLDRSGLLLAQCRSELAEALDDRQASAGRSAWPAALSPAAWWDALRHTLIYHPALSMSVLLIAGFVAGLAGQRSSVAPPPIIASIPKMMPSTAAPDQSQASSPAKVTEEQLRNAESATVQWATPYGSSTPTVHVELMSPDPTDIVGSPEDADIQRALRFLLQNGQRFDPDVRMDSLEVLRMNAADPDVRNTLCDTARLDRNPSVRRKALDALQGYASDPMVRGVLLEAIESDADPGVRVEGIRLVLGALQSRGGAAAAPQAVEALRDRLHNDPNASVRRQSASALRQLGEPAQ